MLWHLEFSHEPCSSYLFIYLFISSSDKITCKIKLTIKLVVIIQEKKINAKDIFGWEATRNHRAFTLVLPVTKKNLIIIIKLCYFHQCLNRKTT